MAGRTAPIKFTEPEAQVLLKVMDAMFADLGEAKARMLAVELRGLGRSEDEILAFARRPASACCDVIAAATEKVNVGPPRDAKKLRAILKALASPAGCLALTGKRGPLFKLDVVTVQSVVRAWMNSPSAQIREISKAFKLLVAYVTMRAGEGRKSPNWPAMGYSGPDLQALHRAARAAGPVDFSRCRVQLSSLERPLGGTSMPRAEVICDCVVVGSGPGGAVMAAELAEAGYIVALLESGRWRSPEEQTCSEAEAFRETYQEGGNLFTEGRAMTILAGAAFGGGAAMNWSCCLPPPREVREEWAQDFGLDWASSERMAEAVERVRERLAMHTEGVELNAANRVLMRGCERLGYQAEVAAQQGWQPQSPDDGGWCSLSWKHGARQGMHGSALLDAARTGKLLVLDGCKAEKVVRDASGAACGVQGTLFQGGSARPVIVRGRSVVVAGGSLQTPLLLLRSGLRNQHIGRHLRLHPAMTIWGRFDEQINFFQGAPMTTVSRVVENQDGRGYGAKIWVPNFHPITWAALAPWQGPDQFKQALAGYGNAAPLISLVRDHGEGKVWEDADGCVHVSYSMQQADKKHLLCAGEHAARILVAAGAREVHSAHDSVEPLKLSSSASGEACERELDAWVKRLHAAGMPQTSVGLGSAHQMGTCRMAASAKQGAVKPSGETWEVPGLFVADTSAFPTASGVNPMWTCAALAYHVAQEVKLRLQSSCELMEPRPDRKHYMCCMSSARAVSVPGVVAVSKLRVGSAESMTDGESTVSSDVGGSTSASTSTRISTSTSSPPIRNAIQL